MLAVATILGNSGASAATDDEVQVSAQAAFGALNAEISHGWETHSSPLVRIADEGPLIRVLGTQRLASAYDRGAVSGMKTLPLADATSLQLSAAAEEKRFRDARELDFGMQSLDAWLRWPTAAGSLGVGGGLQWMSLGGGAFRRREALMADWTLPAADGGFLGVVLDHGINRHAPDYVDLDSRSTLLLIRRQFPKPLDWIDEISVEAGAQREVNQRGFADLASTAYYARVTTSWPALGLKWAFGLMAQDARFDAALLPGLPARRDTFVAIDASCEYPLGARTALRLDITSARNRANVALYESRFGTASLSLAIDF